MSDAARQFVEDAGQTLPEAMKEIAAGGKPVLPKETALDPGRRSATADLPPVLRAIGPTPLDAGRLGQQPMHEFTRVDAYAREIFPETVACVQRDVQLIDSRIGP